jgi:hypothetical protein
MASTSTPMTLTPYFSRPFFLDDVRHVGQVQGFHVSGIRHAGVGHDGGRVRVDQDDLIAQFSEGLAGLSPGIVKLTGLADDDGPGADNHDFADVCTSRHSFLLLVLLGPIWPIED